MVLVQDVLVSSEVSPNKPVVPLTARYGVKELQVHQEPQSLGVWMIGVLILTLGIPLDLRVISGHQLRPHKTAPNWNSIKTTLSVLV